MKRKMMLIGVILKNLQTYHQGTVACFGNGSFEMVGESTGCGEYMGTVR